MYNIDELDNNTFFVSPEGEDSNPGTREFPFKTIGRASEVLTAGSICIIREGIYREMVTPACSGEPGRPIRFMAYPGERVIISGADVVQEWEQYNENIYTAVVDRKVSQIFEKGQILHQARFPKIKKLLEPKLYKFLVTDDIVETGIGDKPAGYWENAIIWAVCGKQWVAQTARVKYSSCYEVTVDRKSEVWDKGMGLGYITNHLSLLTCEGEWHYEEPLLYLWPSGGKKPVKDEIEIKSRDVAFDLNYRSYIEVSGIEIFAARITMDNSSNCTISQCSFQYVNHFVEIKNGWTREKEVRYDSEGVGITVGGHDNKITGCKIAYSAGDGITLYGSNNIVSECVISDCCYSGTDCAAITAEGRGHMVFKNTAYNCGRSVFLHRRLKKSKILNNHFYNGGLLTDDMGITYCYDTDGEGTEIAYNWLHGASAPRVSAGIYIDNKNNNHKVHHNVIWDVSDGIRINLPAENLSVNNNTIFSAISAMGSWGPEGSCMTGINVINNHAESGLWFGNEIRENIETPGIRNILLDFIQSGLMEGEEFQNIKTIILGAGAFDKGEHWTAGADPIQEQCRLSEG